MGWPSGGISGDHRDMSSHSKSSSKLLGAFVSLAWLCSACTDDNAATTGETGDTGDAGDTSDTGDTGGGPSDCAEDLWAELSDRYPDAVNVGSCDGVSGAAEVVSTLMNVEGLTIDDGTGTQLAPCIEARCDASYVYIASNGLFHYDFVQTTPNPLNEVNFIYRVPIEPQALGEVAGQDVGDLLGCVDAHNAFLVDPSTGPNAEPSGMCSSTVDQPSYLRFSTQVVQTIPCLATIATMINGVPVFGPNEAGMPDPWGSPIFFYPDAAGEPYVPDDLMAGAALDLCGGHTGNSAHYHGVNESCFELDASNKPANSYVAATENWAFEGGLAGDCTQESGVVGWSMDGYPIMGPCVCVARDGDGSCTDLRRARSSWVYAGLSSWSAEQGADPDGSGVLDLEGQACTSDEDCCDGDPSCAFACNWAVFDEPGAAGGTSAAKRCVAYDYSWCTHRWVDRGEGEDDGTNFVYLDPCNGYEGPDGYAYHATLSFPYVQGCYRDTPSDSIGPAANGGGGAGGGMGVPTCQAGQTMCCGDGSCDGPETAANCAEDCG